MAGAAGTASAAPSQARAARAALWAEGGKQKKWAAALDGRKFLGGGKPNLGDLAVFGGLRAILGTDTFRDLMIHGAIKPWYLDMEAAVGPASRSEEE